MDLRWSRTDEMNVNSEYCERAVLGESSSLSMLHLGVDGRLGRQTIDL